MRSIQWPGCLAAAALLPVTAAQGAPQVPEPPTATPAGSPGDWLQPDDYPVAALRSDMEGITGFRLSVDAAGMPTACQVVRTSNFDVLDEATCERLMKNARFVPARDRKGRPVPATYSSRVRWVLPEDAKDFRVGVVTMRLIFDRAGKPASCELVQGQVAGDESNPCTFAADIPSTIALAMRGDLTAEKVEVNVDMHRLYAKILPASLTAPVSGYQQRALFVHQFVVNPEGKLASCHITEQRGSALMIQNFCADIKDAIFDPPFDEIGPDGTATGWGVGRVLVRAAE